MKKTFILCNDRMSYVSVLNDQDKAELLTAMFNHQNGLDVGELSYGVKICFTHMIQFREDQDEKYEVILERNRKNGKKGGRPPSEKPKKPSGLSGNPKNPKKPKVSQRTQANPKNPSEPKQTLTDTDTDIITDITSIPNGIEEEISKDISLEEKQILILKFDLKNGKLKEKEFDFDSSHGDQEINQVMAMVLENNDGAMDGTQKGNRNFASHLIKKIEKIPSVAQGETSWQEVLALILAVMKDDQFYGSKVVSPEKIYRNLGTLMSETRKKLSGKKTSDFRSF